MINLIYGVMDNMNVPDFIQTTVERYIECGSVRKVHEKHGMSKRTIQHHLKQLKDRFNIDVRDYMDINIKTEPKQTVIYDEFKFNKKPDDIPLSNRNISVSNTYEIKVTDESDFDVVVFSDSHVIPEHPSQVSHSILNLLKAINPKYVICLGDTFDFASISKHDKSGWTKQYTVKEELDAGCDLLNKIVQYSPDATHLMTFSNHDSRFNKTLAAKIPEFEGVGGFDISDHISNDWYFGISIMLNSNTKFKHQWNNGIHAAWNNVLKSGISIVTGHTHRQLVRPYTDYSGLRYAVEVGTLAEIQNPMFNYTEHSPLDWISGCAVLSYRKGKLITPEFMSLINGKVYFRGNVI